MIKKSLGQNFFVNENLGEKIISYVALTPADIIVEIGPGRGFFTQKLSKISQNLLLVEKDDSLSEGLKNTFSNAIVLNKDFLDWDFKELIPSKEKNIVFFGSLPYNVSKLIIQKIMSSEFFNSGCYFIVQKEVAEKYTAKAPNSNIVSLRTQLFAKTKKLLDISPGSFLPQPKVISSFIQFTPLLEKPTIDAAKFNRFVEHCFRSPRKTLRNNLKNISSCSNFEELMNKRPQELTLEQYMQIFTNLS